MDQRHRGEQGIGRMAVTTEHKTIRDFRSYYYKITHMYLIITQLIIAVSVGLVLAANGILSISDAVLWLVMIIVFILGTSMSLLLLNVASEPLYGILAALAHKANEPTTTTPPNPNAKHNAKTGLKTALQTIYAEDRSGDEAVSEAKATTALPSALDHTSCGVVIFDTQKRIVSANKAAPIARTQTGEPYLALDFLDDQSLTEWIAAIDAQEVRGERTWRRVPTDPLVFKKNRYFDIVASYEKGAAGETIVMLFDNSQRYLPEEEDLNFIAFAAHELRGPITVIRGYLDVLQQEIGGLLQGDQPELMQRLTISANKLSGYINNILNVAKFDRHHLKIHLAEDSVYNIYAIIADDMHMRAAAQHRLLQVSISNQLPTVAADRSSISEVLSNLIDNAIKYSFEGGVVTVSAEQKGDFIEISVADNGVGMPASVVKNLFRKFYRSHRSRETVAGTGIGLYICKAFVESHGGTIIARSRENEGSVFSFTLPIYAAVKDKLLEDGQLNRRLIRQGGGWIKNHAMYRG